MPKVTKPYESFDSFDVMIVCFSICDMQRKVEDWKKGDVYKWLGVLQMSKYEDAFKTISGKASTKQDIATQLSVQKGW